MLGLKIKKTVYPERVYSFNEVFNVKNRKNVRKNNK